MKSIQHLAGGVAGAGEECPLEGCHLHGFDHRGSRERRAAEDHNRKRARADELALAVPQPAIEPVDHRMVR